MVQSSREDLVCKLNMVGPDLYHISGLFEMDALFSEIPLVMNSDLTVKLAILLYPFTLCKPYRYIVAMLVTLYPIPRQHFIDHGNGLHPIREIHKISKDPKDRQIQKAYASCQWWHRRAQFDGGIKAVDGSMKRTKRTMERSYN